MGGKRVKIVNDATKAKLAQYCGKNHWNYGKHLSEETKNKIGNANRGRTSWRKGKTGYKHTLEARENMSKAKRGTIPWNKGKKMSDDFCSKCSLRNKGRIVWNKGMKGKYSLKHSGQFKNGFTPWNKGKKMPRSAVEKMVETKKGREYNYHHTQETKDKISRANTGKEMIVTEETKKKISATHKRNGIVPKYVGYWTKPERRLLEMLYGMGFKCENIYDHWFLRFGAKVRNVDFYIPSLKIIVEVDGVRWHNFPLRLDKDRELDKLATENGYTIIRFWDAEVMKLTHHHNQLLCRGDVERRILDGMDLAMMRVINYGRI